MRSGNHIARSRRRITVDISAELVDWLDEQSATRNNGREIVVERALRDYRRVVERDNANPRPPDTL